MSDGGGVKLDPLFVGLTRPTLFLGVNQKFVMLNGFASISYFIQTSDVMVIIIATLIHMVGYILSFKEPLFIELFMVRQQKCSKCPNKMYHGANSYDVY